MKEYKVAIVATVEDEITVQASDREEAERLGVKKFRDAYAMTFDSVTADAEEKKRGT